VIPFVLAMLAALLITIYLSFLSTWILLALPPRPVLASATPE
jgi:hypothetical protein